MPVDNAGPPSTYVPSREGKEEEEQATSAGIYVQYIYCLGERKGEGRKNIGTVYIRHPTAIKLPTPSVSY